MKDDIANELFVMNNVTVEKLFELGADAFTLYAFYYKTAKWQKTMEPWANNEYVMKNLGWGRPRLLKTKAQLEKAQMIEQVRVVDEKTNQVQKWAIKLKYLQTVSTSQVGTESTSQFFPPVDECDCNNIYNNKISKELNNNNIPPYNSPQGEKKPYGESQFVFLTDTEYAKVKELYGEFLDDAINTLDSYIASNPKKIAKKYSSHFAVLRKNNWVYKEIFGKRKQPLASNVTEDELNSFVDMWNTMVNRLAPRGEFINGNKVRSIVADDIRIMLPDAKRNLLCMINEIKNWDKLPLAINVPLDEENYWNWALIVVANRLLRSSYLRGQAPNAPMFTFDVKFFCYNIKKLANPYDECYLDR